MAARSSRTADDDHGDDVVAAPSGDGVAAFGEWDPASPEVRQLIADLRRALGLARFQRIRLLLKCLITVAEGDGVLPHWGAKLNHHRLSVLAGIAPDALFPGNSARDVADLFTPRFIIGTRGPQWSLVAETANDNGVDAALGSEAGACAADGFPVIGAGLSDADASSTSTAAWDPASPQVVGLLFDLRAALAVSRLAAERAMLAFLIRTAQGDGVLAGHAGTLNFRRLAALAEVRPTTVLPGGSARKVLDLFGGRFTIRNAKFDLDGNELPETMADNVRAWLATNPVVPSRGPTLVSLRGVAELRGFDYAAIADSAHISALIRNAIAAGEATLDPDVWRPKDELIGGLPPEEAATRIEELKEVVRGLDRVPENWRRRGWVDFDYIADLTGRREPTMADVPGYRRWVLAQARSKRTLLPGLIDFVDTVSAFRDWGLDVIGSEGRAAGKATWARDVANQQTNYLKLIDAAGLEPEDEVGDLFGAGFDDLVQKAMGDLRGESAANVRRGLGRWRELRQRRLGSLGLPPELPEALRVLIRARGLTIPVLAAEVGVNSATLTSWTAGTSSPSRASIGDLHRIEDYFKLTRDELVARVGYTAVRTFTKPSASAEFKELGWEIKQLLPEDADSWEPEVLASAVAKVKPLLTAGTRQGGIVRAAASDEHLMEPYRPNGRLEQQMADFVGYKEAKVTHPFLRARKGQWASGETKKIKMPLLESFYRFLAQPSDGRMASGMDVDRALATIAWLGHAPMVLAAAGHRAQRFKDEDWGDGKRGIFYTSREEQLVELAASMTHPVTGWLTQNPQLAETLVPVAKTIPKAFADLLGLYVKDGSEHLLGVADVEAARSDWAGYMARNHATLTQAKNYLSEAKRVSRDPIAPITGLFRSGTPSADLLACILRSEKCWADARTAPLAHALDVRNSVMIRIEDIVTFRPKNLAKLTFSKDEGQIRKRDGVWEIEVPYGNFKNSKNCRLFGPKTSRRNFHQRLVDEAGLYELLDLWFFDQIKQIRRDEDSRAAFVTKSGKTTSEHDWGVIASDFGRRHVAWNPVRQTGVPGVASLNAYAFRHIRASDILCNSEAYNRVEEAAFALQTSETMIIDHYGMLLPAQALGTAERTHSKAVNEALKRLLQEV